MDAAKGFKSGKQKVTPFFNAGFATKTITMPNRSTSQHSLSNTAQTEFASGQDVSSEHIQAILTGSNTDSHNTDQTSQKLHNACLPVLKNATNVKITNLTKKSGEPHIKLEATVNGQTVEFKFKLENGKVKMKTFDRNLYRDLHNSHKGQIQKK